MDYFFTGDPSYQSAALQGAVRVVLIGYPIARMQQEYRRHKLVKSVLWGLSIGYLVLGKDPNLSAIFVGYSIASSSYMTLAKKYIERKICSKKLIKI